MQRVILCGLLALRHCGCRAKITILWVNNCNTTSTVFSLPAPTKATPSPSRFANSPSPSLRAMREVAELFDSLGADAANAARAPAVERSTLQSPPRGGLAAPPPHAPSPSALVAASAQDAIDQAAAACDWLENAARAARGVLSP